MPEEVVRIHGLTGAFLRDKPLFSSVCHDMLAFFGDDMLVAHNSEFDRGFLNAELTRSGLPIFERDRFIDTLPWPRKSCAPGTRLSLDALSKYYRLDQKGFDLTARKGAGGHGALLGRADAGGNLYRAAGRGVSNRSRLSPPRPRSVVETEEGVAPSLNLEQRPQRPVRQLLLSTESERTAHAEFVAGLGAPTLWPAG